MVLSNKSIKDLKLVNPFMEVNCQPASYDLTIEKISGNIDEFLKPNESVLVSTREFIRLPDNVAAFVKTRSSLARLGISTDFAGWVDPGFHGNLTLLMKNLGNKDVDLSKIDRFAQVIFLEVEQPTISYDGHYQNSEGIVESVL